MQEAPTLLALHWLSAFSAGLLLASIYPGLIALAAFIALYFYFAQLAKVVTSRQARAILVN